MTGVDNSEDPRSAIISCTFSVLIAASCYSVDIVSHLSDRTVGRIVNSYHLITPLLTPAARESFFLLFIKSLVCD